MTDLPDDYMDNPTKYSQDIDTLAGNPAGPEILAQNQANATELQQLQIENQLLRNKYNLHDEEDSREGLFREQLEDEVYHAQEFAASEEGAAHIRQGIINEWAQGEPKGQDSHDAYVESYQDRKKREYAEEQERKRNE